jgi:hypothetical protein
MHHWAPSCIGNLSARVNHPSKLQAKLDDNLSVKGVVPAVQCTETARCSPLFQERGAIDWVWVIDHSTLHPSAPEVENSVNQGIESVAAA